MAVANVAAVAGHRGGKAVAKMALVACMKACRKRPLLLIWLAGVGSMALIPKAAVDVAVASGCEKGFLS